MWPFKEQASISELEAKVEKLELRVKAVELEWEMAYEKIRKMVSRLAKRDALEHPAEELDREGAPQTDTTSVLSPTFSRLTPRQRAVQLQVMNRRAGLNGGK